MAHCIANRATENGTGLETMTYFNASRMAPGYGHDPVPSITGSSLGWR